MSNKYLDIALQRVVQQEVDKVLGNIKQEIERLNPVDYGSMFSYESHEGAKYMKEDIIDIIDKHTKGDADADSN